MTTVQTPSDDYGQFDAICAEIDDWQPLPAVASSPADEQSTPGDDQREAALDGLILAGLVSPY
jgi:hypothetical protein